MTKFPNPICYQHNPSLELLCARQAEEDPNHDHDTVTDLVPLRLGHHIVLVPGLHLDSVSSDGVPPGQAEAQLS